ncbi:group II intron reverse transcriptase/maturase [Nesterenkonia sp. MY13]|uniref:RNA-directed DNA polymerase n=1 Tax=Nesterenkonia sedimenti TaxID=1463632 RepID=A0A7X8TLX1_9MICC|nr:group II intron reverse transcriptase/maturase [Nesterenkonia sedimenti]
MHLGGPLSERSDDPESVVEAVGGRQGLWEEIFSRENLLAALKRVEKNAGAAGVDGMSTGELRQWALQRWPETKALLDSGAYRPAPVRQVSVPKPDGGVRVLGVPTVLDRLVQQAIAQVLGPIFEEGFSEFSFGFRPGRSAHDAVRAARRFVEDGRQWVVEVDLDSFFDRVHHDKLMHRVGRKVKDKRVLRLVHRYLQAGIMADGIRQSVREGTPQGSPLSPLLSNIMLDDFDSQMQARGHRFVRYADDVRIFVGSKRAAERVLSQAIKVLEGQLKLRVNQQKSTIAPATVATLLGFGFFFTAGRQVGIRIAPKAFKRLKQRIRELTSRRWSISMGEHITRLNRFIRGWMGYFGLISRPGAFRDFDSWFRRRMRQIRWKEWKLPRTRWRNLRRLGIAGAKAYEWSHSSRGYWRVAGSPILARALPNEYWSELGLWFFTDAWHRFNASANRRMRSSARTVV